MATNRSLRKALLEHLKVTPQCLSQRVGQVKAQHGPMSTEDATYVIAQQEGLDLSRYLEPATVGHVRELMPRPQQQSTPGSVKKHRAPGRRPVVVRIAPSVQGVDALLSTTLAQDARRMAEIYPKYYVLENSIRIVIMRVMQARHGKDWWEATAGKDVRDRVAKRIEKEAKQPWHGKRGSHKIFYSDFGDLKSIIAKNWDDFKQFFPTAGWIYQKLDELEHPRNVMAHHNPLSGQDVQRIDLYFSDWIAVLTSKGHLIPG